MGSNLNDHDADLPFADLPFRVKVTVGAAMKLDGKRLDESHNPRPRLRFRTHHFGQNDVKSLSDVLAEDLASTTGLVVLIVENWFEWASTSFKAALPNFPLKLLTEVNGGLGLAMIPIFNDGDEVEEFCSIMDHFDIVPSPSGGNSWTASHKEQWEARGSPIATWVKNQGAFIQDPGRPAVVMFGGNSFMPFTQRIVDHYQSEDSRRWERLRACLPWIFLDIFYIFTNWDSTLEIARLNVEAKEQEMFNRKSIAPIIQQTRDLHQDASNTLALQEGLRMHQATFRRFKRGLTKTLLANPMDGLGTRMDYVSELLDFYETTCDTIIQQQKNLLSLAFNLETVTQSQAVARLNALAVVFLPISFVASIFGITTITVPAFWYPVAAIPTLLVTCAIAFVLSASTDMGAETRSQMKALSLLFQQRLPFSLQKQKKRHHPDEEIAEQRTDPSHSTTSVGARLQPVPEIIIDSREEESIRPIDVPSERVVYQSSMNLGYRVRGVARSNQFLTPRDMYVNAAPGALNSPSGTLRH